MASIIPGYNYDIFISYRQKDNKGDRWVSEFVDALKTELESTFKEEISVYFDINPHDGLLETHDVDESLKEKLKCLVFIPIISRTYCDPKSFAWEHEFKAFIEQASKDQYGLKVKLSGGNVANRVLPVQIHELDSDDKKMVEDELGGHIRGIEFIYKSPGINRPLLPKEENPQDNLNHTNYKDQINKVANAIDEILHGLKRVQATPIEELKDEITPSTDVRSPIRKLSSIQDSKDKAIWVNKKKIIYVSSSLVIVLAVIAIFIFSSGSTLPFSKRDWIIITDFENLTNDAVFDKCLNTAFSLSTSQSRYINIFPRSRMLETLAMMGTKDRTYIDEKTGREMAIRQGINIYIVPGISEVGNRYAISAKIIETKSDNILNSEVLYAESRDEILMTLDLLSKNIRRQLGESRYSIANQDKPLAKVTTSSLEALKQYSLGIERHWFSDFKGAKTYYENALRIDSGFIAAKASLGNLLIQRFNPSKGRELLDQAVKSIDNLTDREKYGILAFHAVGVDNNYVKAISNTETLIRLYPDDYANYNNLGWYYQQTEQYEKALIEYKKAVNINPNLALTYSGILWIYDEFLGKPDSLIIWAEKMISDNPNNAWGYCHLGSAWFCMDSLVKAQQYYLKARELDPYLTLNLYRLAHTYRILGMHKEAIRILEIILENNKNEIDAYSNIGINYQAMGNQEDAWKYFSIFKKLASEIWIKEYPDNAATYTKIGSVNARLNEMDSSRLMLQKAIDVDFTRHFEFATVLCLQGKITEAIDEIEKALENGYHNLTWLKMNPDLEILRYDIRFRDLLQKYFE